MKIEINNTTINYETYGQGQDILVLHGWGGCINSMLPIINKYKEKYRITAIDFPGHGESSIVNSWDVTDYMNNLYAFINKMQLKNIYIISHSFGGRVAILLASAYPELVKKLILVDSGGIMPKRTMKYYLKTYTYKLGKKFMKLCIRDKNNYNEWLENERKKKGSSDYNSLSEEMKSTFVKVVNQNLKPYLKKISCPTLIMWGEFDTDTPVYMASILNKGIKNSELHVLENCAHFSYLDDLNTFNKYVEPFLNK